MCCIKCDLSDGSVFLGNDDVYLRNPFENLDKQNTQTNQVVNETNVNGTPVNKISMPSWRAEMTFLYMTILRWDVWVVEITVFV